MTMTYDNLPAEQREWFDLFFGDLMFGSTYWTGGAELDDGRWTFSDREDVTDTKTYVITRDDVLATLATGSVSMAAGSSSGSASPCLTWTSSTWITTLT